MNSDVSPADVSADDLSKNSPAATDNGKWFERALLLAVLLASAVAISPNPADPDLWGHVQYGRDVLATGELPATTTYSYTAEGYRWINHENLSEIVFAIGADTIGPIGLLIVKCLLGLGLVALIMRHGLRQGVGTIAICLVSMLVAVNMAFHWSVRPQLLSFVHFTLMIVLLSWCFQGWEGGWRLPWLRKENEPLKLEYSSRRLRFLWLAPVLLMTWTNSHGGFVAGFCIYTAYLGCRAIEALACRGKSGTGLALRMGMMIAAGGLATLINPYGPGLHRWLLNSLTLPRPEITEWWSPSPFELTTLPLWLLVGTFILSICLSRRSRDFTHLVLLGVTLWQSLEHQRHIPFFAVLFGFWMPVHVESMLRRLAIVRDGNAFAGRVVLPLRVALVGGMVLAYAVLGYKLYDRLRDMPVDREHYPVAALQYMADQNLQGRLVVTYNWAQYAIAAFGVDEPGKEGIRVSFDGRFRTCYPQEIVDMHFDFWLGEWGTERRYRSPASPPPDPNLVLEYGKPDLVLISRGQPISLVTMMANRDRWVLLYQDSLSQLWGRKSVYDDPASVQYIPPVDRDVSDKPQTGVATWPALPIKGRKASRLVNQPGNNPPEKS